jgi:hypothetical protein
MQHLQEGFVLRYFSCLGVGLMATTALVHAQSAPSGTGPASPSSPAAEVKSTSEPPEKMEDPQLGDHWTYELRDEVSGEIKSTFVQTVTDATATEISVRTTVLGNPNNGYLTFDRGWNLTNNGTWRYTPNDGSGVRMPLSVGKSWTVKSTDARTAPNATWKRSGTAKVLGQESITTRAGTFDTFKLELSSQLQSSTDPTKKVQFVQQTWYAPAIDHWVKRTAESRQDGHLKDKSSMELIEYGRR